MNALVYVDIDQGIHKGKMKVALNEKRKKLRGFSFSINIANFKAFLSVFKLTKNPLFLKSFMDLNMIKIKRCLCLMSEHLIKLLVIKSNHQKELLNFTLFQIMKCIVIP